MKEAKALPLLNFHAYKCLPQLALFLIFNITWKIQKKKQNSDYVCNRLIFGRKKTEEKREKKLDLKILVRDHTENPPHMIIWWSANTALKSFLAGL